MPRERSPEEIQELIKGLLSFQRQEELDAFEVMAFLPIEPCHHVADIGCGPGFFSIPLAKYLILGKLYALDTQEAMLEALRQRVQAMNLGNVEILQCEETEFPLPAGSLDGAFIAFVLHENQDREGLLKASGELLRRGGWCAVLEWYDKEVEGGPPPERRIGPEALESLARRVDLRFRWWRDINGKHYMALLRK